MTSLADKLPPDIAQAIHPQWRKNEAEYWLQRDRLLAQYAGQWIGFADGKVVAAGNSPVDVFHAAQQTGLHPFFTLVGREDQPCQMRRMTFGYDTTYHSEALPLVRVEFRLAPGSPGVVLDRVIPDTGADGTAVPWTDCKALQLDPAQGVPGLIGGVGGSTSVTVAFQVWAHLDGQDHPCRLQADLAGHERILGRDVLNRVEILFRGPSAEVVVNP